MEWNEEEHCWEIRIYEVEDDLPYNLDPEEVYRRMYPEGGEGDTESDEILARLRGV